MRAWLQQFVQALARVTMRSPERLWVHYCFALVLFFGLILGAYLLNGAAVSRSVAASQGIKLSNQQSLLAIDIVQMAGAVDERDERMMAQFRRTVLRFEATHKTLLEQHISSSALEAHYSATGASLKFRIQAFIILANRAANNPQEGRGVAARRLQDLYYVRGLRADLREATVLFSNHVEQQSAYFAQLQRTLLLASALVLIVEAIFVFWPAQYTVQSTIAKMKRQTNVLRASQQRLAHVNDQLEHIVNHDPLTGLPNRTSLIAYLSHAIERRQVSGSHLYLVGLDDFKSVNDMIGHDFGDALLVAVSDQLKVCVDYDSMVAHVGGDEFVLISQEATNAVVRRINDALLQPFDIKGRRIPINASIGHVQIEDAIRQPLDIVADAEIALKFAKNAGGNRNQPYDISLRDELSLLHKLQSDLRDAIANGEIEPWFQPQIRLADGRLHGAEVLARWRHPTRGLLTPDKFLPAAERAGLMVDLDHAVWAAAMRHALEWQRENVWRPCISLNAAPDTISDPHLIERFLFALQRSGLDASQVIVEVLETTLIDGKDDMAAINIDSLSECGIALELDDFGTGYASLSKLTQLPLAGIKLDRSLVAPLPDQGADSVVRAIIALAAELGLKVIAEGVEENTQAEHLRNRGCEIGQGYGFGKPMPPQEFAIWLSKNAGRAILAGPDVAHHGMRA